jgi:hypothetical protein
MLTALATLRSNSKEQPDLHLKWRLSNLPTGLVVKGSRHRLPFRLAISSVIHISKRIPIISTSHFGRSRDRSDNTASPTYLRLSLVQVLPPTLRLHPTLNLIRSAITLMLVSVPPCVHPIRQVWQGHSRHQISLRWRPYRVASPVCQHRRQHRATRPTHNLCPLLR